jgi:mannose-6-phosphate isomerase-like protein (cupin superfamily)
VGRHNAELLSQPDHYPARVADDLIVVPPGGGERVGNVEFLALSEDTPRFNLSVITMQPHRDGPELHAHEDEDDCFYVLEGELTFHTGDAEFSAPAGTFVLAPPGVQHTFSNRTDAIVRILNVHAPAGFDRRLRDE